MMTFQKWTCAYYLFKGAKGVDVLGVMHDFEYALVNSIDRWFKCDYHLGCFFHWKQAIRHNLIEWGFKKESVKLLLPMFDFLTVVEKGDIRKGVEFIRDYVTKGVKLKKDGRIMFERYLDYYFISGFSKE